MITINLNEEDAKLVWNVFDMRAEELEMRALNGEKNAAELGRKFRKVADEFDEVLKKKKEAA